MKKRIIVTSMLMALYVFFPTACGGIVENIGTTDTSADEITASFSGIQKGQYVTFGTFEQDNNFENGAEPIEWEVLDIDGDKALLISKYVLDSRSYEHKAINVTWETCELRSWLNNDFYNAAFSNEEQKKIQTVTLINEDNLVCGTKGGNVTSDKVFCISLSDVKKYHTFNTWNEKSHCGYSETLVTAPTEYAKNVTTLLIDEDAFEYWGLKEAGYSQDIIGTEGTWWWLRTPGSHSNFTCCVDQLGRAGEYVYSTSEQYFPGVRPALYVTIK